MKIISQNKFNEFTTVFGKNVNDIIRKYKDPVKWDNYRKNWRDSVNLKSTPPYPIQLDFELNYSCNFRCSMCTWSAENTSNKGKSTWISFELYKEIIDEGVNKGLSAVRLNYINEPLIRKDIFDFIEYADKKGILDIYFSTNGSLLTEDNSKKLINSGLTRLQVSIDATSKDVFDKVRQGGSYNTVLNNVLKFLDIRKKLNKELPTLRVNFVKTDLNKHQLDEFLEFWSDKSDCIGIQNLVNIMKPSYNKNKNINFKCSQPFTHMTLRYDGSLLPCCAFFGAKLPIAKIKNESKHFISNEKNLENPETNNLEFLTISKTWNSKRIKELREIHSKGEYYKNDVCNQCVNSSSHIDFEQ